MKYSTQAIALSSALAKVLIEKGILTQAELNAAMSSTQKVRESLLKIPDDKIIASRRFRALLRCCAIVRQPRLQRGLLKRKRLLRKQCGICRRDRSG